MIKIEIERETGMVYLDKTLLGRDKENLQEMLYFTFRDGIFNGTGRLEYKLPNGESHFVLLETNGIDYYLPIKNVLLENGHIEMQFVLTESETEEGIPVFKSNIFTLYCKESINAVEEQPSDYELWIETANAKLAEIDDAIEQTSNLDIDIEKVGHTATITLTDKEGVQKEVEINDGVEQEIIGGTNISVEEDGNTITINNTYDDTTILNNIETLTNAISEHDTDIQNIENNIDTIKQDIYSIETEIDGIDLNKQDNLVSGTNIKTINGYSVLGSGNIEIQGGGSGNFEELTNRPSYNGTIMSGSTNIPIVPTKTSELTNDSGYLTSHQDISGKVNVSDIINDTSHTDTNKPLSANMGKEIQDQIDNLKSRGRFLSLWNCTTGLATTIPTENPYTYKTGDYFIISVVGDTNYKPNGATYDKNIPSTSVETREVNIDDVYYYDGTNWDLQINTQKTINFANIGGSPTDNTNLSSALNSKQNVIDSTHKLPYSNISGTPTIPSGALASLNSIDYTSNYITNKPTIPTNTVSSTTITSIVKLTQAEYDAITTKDANTIYTIVG